MDTKIQTLVRKAASGDGDACKQLFAEKRRSGQIYTDLPGSGYVEIKYGKTILTIIDNETLTVTHDYSSAWIIDKSTVYFEAQVFKFKDGFWVHIPDPQYDSQRRDLKAKIDYSGTMFGVGDNITTGPTIITMLSVKINQMFADPEKFPRIAAIADNNKKIAAAMEKLTNAEQVIEEATTELGGLFLEQAKL
jgi:hypothetical protein